MSKLVKRAQDIGVGIAIEGIGHAPIEFIPQIVPHSKSICYNAAYRVLNVATDIAIGFDHVASAIGSAVAVLHGANSITCVTRAEHLGIPTLADCIEGVQCAKIAAYCGFAGRTGNHNQDQKISIARSQNGCIGCIDATLFPDLVQEYILTHNIQKKDQSCSMCGSCCPYVILANKE